MQAKDIMNADVVTVTPETDIKAIAKILAERQISAVPVVDEAKHILGIVSEGDLIRRADRTTFKGPKAWWLAFIVSPEKRAKEYIRDHGTRARDVMTDKVISVPEVASLHDIAVLMEKHRIKRVPVTRDGTLAGIVSRANVLQGFVADGAASVSECSTDDRVIREQVIAAIREADESILSFTDVVVKEGMVHLWGGVRSKAQFNVTEIAARNVPGVRKVENRMAVMPELVQSTLWAE